MSGAPPFGPVGAPQLQTSVAGASFSQLIQVLAQLVNATNAQANVISTTSISGVLLGDVVGTASATKVIDTHLLVPLTTSQGGTGNTTGQPSGAAGGDLSGSYPNPSIQTVGLWTPAIAFNGASTGIVYSTQHGSYTKIGRIVTCFFTLTLTSVGSATGAATITGLPFPSNADIANAGAGGICPSFASMSGLSNSPLCNVGSASSVVSLLQASAATTNPVTNANFTNATMISGSFNYFV